MEFIKKTKKCKKRRHRSINFKKSLSLIDMKIDENCKANSIKTDSAERSDLMRHQLVQTDNLNLQEERLDSKNLLTEKDEEIKNLTERLHQVTSKLYESKNAYTSLKQDFNKAQKLLCSEIGDNVTVAGLTSQPGAWRGRAEQIQQLQQKLSELQGKVSESDSSSKRTLERRSSSSVRIFDKERKQQIENLTKELKEAEVGREQTKKKLDASKARIAVLENELNISRKTIGLLNEKSIRDNEMIDTLHSQLKAAEVKFQERENEAKRQKDKLEREIVLLKCEVEAAQIHLQNAKRQLDGKDKELENLSHLRNNSGTVVDRPSREIESPKLESREASEYVAIGLAAEAERQRLLELVTVLNQRLDKERNEFERLSESFRKERTRAVKLDAKLQKLELERVGLAKVNTGSYYRLRAPRISSLTSNDSSDSEEMRQKFELLQEECLTLKTRLAAIQKDKAADLAAFKKMLEQTRQIFKDAYRGKLPAVGCHSSVTI